MEEVKVYGFSTKIHSMQFIKEKNTEKIFMGIKKESLGVSVEYGIHIYIFEKKTTAEKFRKMFKENFDKYMKIGDIETGSIPKEEYERGKENQKLPPPKKIDAYCLRIKDMPVKTKKEELIKFFETQKALGYSYESQTSVSIVFETKAQAEKYKTNLKKKFKNEIKLGRIYKIILTDRQVANLKKEIE